MPIIRVTHARMRPFAVRRRRLGNSAPINTGGIYRNLRDMTTTTTINLPHATQHPQQDKHDAPEILFKNPIVQQLWKARQLARMEENSSHPTDVMSSGRAPSESRVQVVYDFKTNSYLLNAYRNPWGQMRLGKLMEDLDALAGNIAYLHGGRNHPKHPMIVTASVDRIRLRERPQIHDNQLLSGQVTWTGTSSMEIKMTCTTVDAKQPWLECHCTFVTLDPETKKPTAIPPVLPQTPKEHADYAAGEQRAAIKKMRRNQQLNELAPSIALSLAQALLDEGRPLLTLPSLADPNAILIESTKLSNAMIAQPQVQNLHNRIFGGFLMRRAFELAFANAYVFGGARPLFLEVDEVSFWAPVDVGDLVVFNSRVIYTDYGYLSDYYEGMTRFAKRPALLPLVHIEVEAWVTEPEKATAKLSNQFYFSFAIADKQQVRRVLPANLDEAMRMALRIGRDDEQRQT
ncbi:hypothetical protein MPSEU_000370000 [Mayamaea pseudoterrestris]|nr:hypothetical protein MPSEU_000370000 [Mayamaea pseudoterrestris]